LQVNLDEVPFAFARGEMSAENDRRTVTANDTPISENFPAVEVAPRGQQPIRELRYSPWRKLCFKAARSSDTKIVCRTTINGAWDTGQVAIRFDLIEREGDAAARLQIFVPTGLYLQPGIKLTVDAGPPCKSHTSFASQMPAWPEMLSIQASYANLSRVRG